MEPSTRRSAHGQDLLKVSYSVDGLKGVMKEGGTSRVKAVERALAGVGGSLESFYFAFGGGGWSGCELSSHHPCHVADDAGRSGSG
jgi:hypothetical protein